jgi:hypothetical protein
MSERHEGKYAVFEAGGGFAPTLGIIGTVMGLINVLSHLDKPDELGHSIAVAFIATLYGVMSANVFWLPLGARLKQRNKEEVAMRTLSIEGVLAVQAGDNPRVVREKLEAFLPPALRGEEEPSESGAAAGGAPQAAAAKVRWRTDAAVVEKATAKPTPKTTSVGSSRTPTSSRCSWCSSSCCTRWRTPIRTSSRRSAPR